VQVEIIICSAEKNSVVRNIQNNH